MTVCLTQHNDDSVVPLFASCLHSLPNLHTLQVMHVQSPMMVSLLKDAFANEKYPQIRTVVLPSLAHGVLRACPEVRDVTCNDALGAQLLLSAIDTECRKVEVVSGIDVRTKIGPSKSFFATTIGCALFTLSPLSIPEGTPQSTRGHLPWYLWTNGKQPTEH